MTHSALKSASVFDICYTCSEKYLDSNTNKPVGDWFARF